MGQATNSIKGVVDQAFTKVKSTRVGDKTINHVIVDGIEFQTGFKAVFTKGEMIDVAVEYNYGAWQWVESTTGTGLPAVPAAGSPAAAAAPSGGGRGSGTFPIDPKSGQISIIRQNSLNRAVEILESWMTLDTPIFMPSDQDQYLKKLLEVALIVTDFNSGQHIMELAAAQAANMEVANG